MPQVINTNIPSLTARRNLDSSQGLLETSLTRLSSGLRINSAKDDAAGLAISTRFNAQISGATQAQRNANDAVSLSQLAEGALGEATNILQRIRTLAVQSANGTNSATDRAAMQAEANQLIPEITRIGDTIQFNNVALLNGTFTGTNFQIGSNANQTVSVSISDCRSTALGSYQVSTNNTHGIEAATSTMDYTADAGTEIGVAQVAASTNGYTASTFSIGYNSTTGGLATVSQGFAANTPATAIASGLNTLAATAANAAHGASVTGAGGVQAFNKITLSALTGVVAGSAMSLAFNDGGGTNTIVATNFSIGSGTALTIDAMANAINSNATAAANGIYAVYHAGATTAQDTLDIYATKGQDLQINNSGSAGTVTIASDVSAAADAGTVVAAGAVQTRGGRVDAYLSDGYTLTEATPGSILSASYTPSRSGVTAANALSTGGNAVAAQNLLVSGPTGNSTVSIAANSSASAIATAVNGATSGTGVTAIASTTATISNLSQAGTVSFELYGNNSAANKVAISAPISNVADLTPLLTSINSQTSATGISASFGTGTGSTSSIVLSHATGADIKIVNYSNSSGVTPANSALTPVTGDGSTQLAVNETSMSVTGNTSTNPGGATVKLYSGGSRAAQNSTVVGGQISFTSTGSFTVDSSIDGVAAASFSLFGNAANGTNASTLTSVSTIDLSTAEHAQSAIGIIDTALNQVNSNRASLGAIQSRFQSAINSLGAQIVNLSAANSRIKDADFAEETANLTKAQILSQAGTSILSQANQLPQQVLSLLQ